MGCFNVQKTKKKVEEQPTKLDEVGDESEPSPSSSPSAVLSAPPSFRKTVRTVQNAQRFITRSSARFRSSLACHGSREHKPEQGIPLSDVGSLSKPMPMPLPSPHLSPTHTCYALPHPSDHANTTAGSPIRPAKYISSVSGGHGALNSRVYPWDLQPLPPPKDAFIIPRGMISYPFEELASACQQFSNCASIGDDGFCFAGAIKTGGCKGIKQKQQDVVILRLHEKLHLDLKDWIPELLTVTHLHNSHLCKPMGFHCEDGKVERFLVYEKLPKGSLHNMIFGASDTPPLDWPTRVKIIHGAIQGLATLHEKFPEQILYRDFRLSHIQVDSDNNTKLSGYWFVTSNNQIMQTQLLNDPAKARGNAYCAPETRSRGTITLKSNVWSLGVIMLEILCGRKNRDGRVVKDDKHNLVKWAKPFLVEDDKLFLIMDPKLQGCFPSKGAKVIASLILQCLQKDPTRRPSAKFALDMVKAVQEMRQTSVLMWRECAPNEAKGPSSAPLPSLALSQSFSSASSQILKPGIVDRTTKHFNRSPTKFDLIQSPVLRPLTIPSRSCAE